MDGWMDYSGTSLQHACTHLLSALLQGTPYTCSLGWLCRLLLIAIIGYGYISDDDCLWSGPLIGLSDERVLVICNIDMKIFRAARQDEVGQSIVMKGGFYGLAVYHYCHQKTS